MTTPDTLTLVDKVFQKNHLDQPTHYVKSIYYCCKRLPVIALFEMNPKVSNVVKSLQHSTPRSLISKKYISCEKYFFEEKIDCICNVDEVEVSFQKEFLYSLEKIRVHLRKKILSCAYKL